MTLFAVITSTAVFLGLAAIAPGLAIVLALLSIPAWVRAVTYSRRWRKTGRPLTPLQQLSSFVGSLVVLVTMLLAVTIAFFSVCLPLGALTIEGLPLWLAVPLFYGGWGLGIAAGSLLGGILLYRLWIAPLMTAGAPPTMRVRLAQFVTGVTQALTAIAGAFVGLGIVAAVSLVWRLLDPTVHDTWTPIPIPGAAGQVSSYFACSLSGLVGVITALWLTRRRFVAQIILVVSVAGALLGLWLGVVWQFALSSGLIDAGWFAEEQRTALETAVLVGMITAGAITGGLSTFILCRTYLKSPRG